jgi:hypothetical protein
MGQAARPPLCEILGGPAESWDADGLAFGFIWTVLPRHGRRPVAFLGRELLRADNAEAVRAGLRTEWSDIRIFELQERGFVTAVRHLRADDGLPRWQDAWASADASGVVASLCAHDPDGPGQESLVPAWHDLLHAVFGASLRA